MLNKTVTQIYTDLHRFPSINKISPIQRYDKWIHDTPMVAVAIAIRIIEDKKFLHRVTALWLLSRAEPFEFLIQIHRFEPSVLKTGKMLESSPNKRLCSLYLYII